MSCKPDTKKTKLMYDLYQQGHSCGQVAHAFGVSRQTVFKRFQRQGLKLRKIKPLPYLIYLGIKYTLRSNGYYACTKGEREFLHRAVWEHNVGKINKGWDIHHIDGDKTNNAIENLELYTKSKHASKFNTGNNQYTKKAK